MGVLLNRPIYYILPAGQPWLGVYADDGRALAAVDATTAARVAGRHAPADAQPVLLGVVETIDQWTLTNSLNLHRPLYRFGLDDGGGTELYVSAKTGEMVMQHDPQEPADSVRRAGARNDPQEGTLHHLEPAWTLRAGRRVMPHGSRAQQHAGARIHGGPRVANMTPSAPAARLARFRSCRP